MLTALVYIPHEKYLSRDKYYSTILYASATTFSTSSQYWLNDSGSTAY